MSSTGRRINFFCCALAGLFLWCVTNASTTWQIGLISDDYDFIAQTSHAWYLPFDTMHWSPFLRRLFAGIAAHHFSPQAAHVGISILHAGVSCALGAFLRWGLGASLGASWLAALLWSVTPAASESVYWLCASGNVCVSLMLIPAIYLAMRPNSWKWTHAFALAGLQAVACLAWDWGALLLPTVVVVRGIACRDRIWDEKLRLWPATGVWILYQSIRAAAGTSSGYGWFPEGTWRAVKDLLLAPAMTFAVDLPQILRVALGVFCWGAMLLSSRKHRGIAALVAGFAFLQLPSMLFGVLQARYLYVSGPMFYAAIVKIVDDAAVHIPWRRTLATACCAFLCWQSWCFQHRASAWRDASVQAEVLLDDIKKHVDRLGSSAVAIKNVPDSYGDPRIKWRPFLWRRGLQTQVPQAMHISFDAQAENGHNDVPVDVPVIEVENIGNAKHPRYAVAPTQAQANAID